MTTLTGARRPPLRVRTNADVSVGLMRHPTADDRMVAVLEFRDTHTGRRYIVELSAADLRNLRADCERLLNADQTLVSRWWAVLANGTDGRPKAKR